MRAMPSQCLALRAHCRAWTLEWSTEPCALFSQEVGRVPMLAILSQGHETQGKDSAQRETAYRLRAAPPNTFGLAPSNTPLAGGMGAHGFTQIPQNQRSLQIASHEVWGNI